MRDVVGFEGLYKVTSCGKIWSCRRNRFMRFFGGPDQYQMIGLTDADGKQHFDYIHRIVAKAYVPNPNNYPEVNHKDEHKDHNWASNLEWCTRIYNMNYGTRTERAFAEGKQYDKQIRAVYCVELGTRYPSTAEAARKLKLYQPNISLCCNGKLKTTGGYHFRFES